MIARSLNPGYVKCDLYIQQALISQCNDKRIALIGDGAKYHSSAEVKDFLLLVNNGLDECDWKITCLRFAPHDPTQNPMEDIWLQAKQWIRECYHLCQTFAAVKYIAFLKKMRYNNSSV